MDPGEARTPNLVAVESAGLDFRWRHAHLRKGLSDGNRSRHQRQGSDQESLDHGSDKCKSFEHGTVLSSSTRSLGRLSAANVRETLATPQSSLSAALQAPNARCSSAGRRSHLSPPAWLVALALLPTTCRRRWSVPAWLTWSERVERKPWRLAGKTRNRPSPHAYVPAVRRRLHRLLDRFPELNESCRPRSRSRNSRSRYARDLEPGLRGSGH